MNAGILMRVLQLLQQGDYRNAAAKARSALNTFPESLELRFYLSAAESKLGRIEAAVENLTTAAAATKDDAWLLKIGKALQNLDAYAPAKTVLGKADQNRPAIALALAQLRWQQGDYGPACRQFAAAHRRWPGDGPIWLAYISALLQLGLDGDAARQLQRASSAFPRIAEFRHLMALQQISRGENAAAQAAAREALALEPGNAQYQNVLAGLNRLLNAPSPFPPSAQDARSAAKWQGFQWLNRRPAKIRWFGYSPDLLKYAVAQIPEAAGPVVECGVYHGRSINLLAELTRRPIWGFDSFEGLPEDWNPAERAGSYSTGRQLPAVAEHVHLVPGWFEETLPAFAERLEQKIVLLHIDCDLYSSTRTALEQLVPKLAPGAIVLFDDLVGYPGFEAHEFKAFQEWFGEPSADIVPLGAVFMGRAVAFRYSRS